MVYFVFFCSSIATPVPLPLLCSAYITFLINIFWAIHQELFFMSILRRFVKLQQNPWRRSFGKIVSLQHPNLLKWNPTISVFFGITDIVFWVIFGNSYHMESLQIIDNSFFLSGFFTRTFTIHRTAGEGVGYLLNSSLPLPHASPTPRH